VAELGISERVQLLPWLSDEQFEAVFAGASGVLFPSDFEGFGLPAIEALRLGIPLVISPDPALLEVTAGHAEVANDETPATLADAITRALALSPDQLAAGREHARAFTWERMARRVREALAQPQSPLSSR
jgi:glycosyltransferase involved in cell wall biosynthesis